jgi:hypothetical protein
MTGGDNNKSKSIPIVCLLVSWLLFNHANKLLMKKAHQVKESAVYVDCRVFFQNPFFPRSSEDSNDVFMYRAFSFCRFKGTMTRDLLLQFFYEKGSPGLNDTIGDFFRKIPKILATEGCSPVSTTQAKTVEKYQRN